ncbi:MAG: Rv2732c family membrane protein [Mycobacterium sp.]
MCTVTPENHRDGDFDDFKGDIEAVERRIAREIDPGARALVISVAVFVLLGTFILSHTGGARGWDVLAGNEAAIGAGISLPSRVFVWLALVFGVGFSMLALLTRRWALAWVALAGSTLASFSGLLAVWSRQTALGSNPGPGLGLVIAWITVIVLAYNWARVVWARTALQLAAEEERRRAAAKRQTRGLLESLDDDTGTDGDGSPKS